MTHIAAVDLFCGIGGLTRGLLDAGIDVIAGLDTDERCEFAYSHNNQALFIPADIARVSGQDLRMLYPRGATRMLAGCAPCQPFSPLARKNPHARKSGRYRLLRHFARLVEDSSPHIVTMENVAEVRDSEVFDEFVSRLSDAGYEINFDVLNCMHFGVPQDRRRLVLVAARRGYKAALPEPIEEIKTVRDAIKRLPALRAGAVDKADPLHRARSLSSLNLARIRHSKPGGFWRDWPEELIAPCHKKAKGKSFRSVYSRMQWDAPSPTITTQFYNFGTGRYGHPTQARAISLREAALIQTFPRSYRLTKEADDISFVHIGTHIGNAVPVRLGRAIGEAILSANTDR